MVLCIAILVGITVLVFYIWKKVIDMQKLIEERINDLTELSVKPIKKASDMAQTLLSGAARTTKRKKR